MNTKLLTSGGLVLAVVLLLAINILSSAAFRSMRIDLTENQLYTLSEGTRNILSSLDEPITVRLFLSQKLATRLPGISSYAVRVKELLDEYRRAAGGNLLVHVIDPEAFSEAEDRAVGYGVQAVPLSDSDAAFYFGLVGTGSTDEEAVIPFFSPDREEFLEYDITKLIHQVAYPKKTVVGLMSSLSMEDITAGAAVAGGLSQPWIVLDQMRQLFDVRTLETDVKAVPEDIDVLMLVHPKDLSEHTLYAIDQFVLRGGRALVFVDPHAEADQGSATGSLGVKSSELGKLMDAWGLELTSAKVVGDLQLAETVRFNRQSRIMAVEYPVWINLPPSQINAQDIVTANLGSLMLATPGRLTPKSDIGTQVSPLMESTTNAMQIDAASLAFLTDPQDLLRQYRPEGERYTLAARVTGKVNSAFPDGPPEDAEDDKEEDTDQGNAEGATNEGPAVREHLAESKEAINIIVVADTDLLQDRFWVRVQDLLGTRIAIPTAANGTFVVNALDNLAGSNDLISVRNRGHFTRPFTRVSAIRQEAELRFREKEQQLLDRLREAERKLVELERGKQGDNTLILSAAQQQEIERFRQEKIRVRKELRNVRHEMHKNIESLEGWTKFINIGLVPLLIGVGGLGVGLHRVRRRKTVGRTTAGAAREE